MRSPGLANLTFGHEGAIGLDFGTTNSAAASVTNGGAELADFAGAEGSTQTFPSVLYFERVRLAAGSRFVSSAGPTAIRHYLDAEDKGRLVQSLKAYLADRRFDGTAIFGRRYSLEDMITLLLKHLLTDVAGASGVVPRRVVAGRPVHFSNSRDQGDDAFAEARLRASLERCGFEEIVFEFEPVAAAYSYEQTLDRDELIMIGDFGGGTSDFSILRIGPGVRRSRHLRDNIIGNDGVAVAGDAFDKQIIRHLVAPRLGRGSDYLSPPDKVLPIPNWPYEHLERWHYLSFLNTHKNLEMLARLKQHATAPARLEAFVHLIKGELGYQLHEAVRRTKFELSQMQETTFAFNCEPVAMSQTVTRAEFERWIEPELTMISGCVDGLLASSGVAAGDIDHVFLTGGSSFVPAVRQVFIDRFGAARIRGGHELTSVATGLALRAQEQWGSS
jgi:hypothetical chaperone protein